MITQEGSLAFDFSSQRSSRAYVQYVHLALVELMALLVHLHRVGMLCSRAQDAYRKYQFGHAYFVVGAGFYCENFTYLKAAHIVLTPRRLTTNTYTLGEGEGNTKVTKPSTPTKIATPAPRDSDSI